MLETDIRKNKGIISECRSNFIKKCNKVCFTREEILVITKFKVDPETLFNEFYEVIKLTIDAGLVRFKTEDEVTLEDLEGNFVEF